MRFFVGLAALLVGFFCFTTDVLAHASLVSAEPGDGSVLSSAPKTVQLRFSESVTPAVISLIDAKGETRGDASVRVSGDTITITLPASLPRGTQVVSYRVISEDGHPVAGSTVFSIGAVTGKAAEQNGVTFTAGLIWLMRIGVYFGWFVGVGGAFFASWIARDRERSRIITAALITGLFSAALSLGLQGLDLLDIPFAALATFIPWQAALATSLGPSLLIAIAAMAAAIVAQRNASGSVARTLSALALAGVGVSLASSGHAASAPPPWLTRTAVFLHGVGVAFWVGALVPLAAMARKSTSALLPVLNRFSRTAIPVVGLLVLAGLALSVVQLESFRALIETSYGLLLSIKLALVVVLLGLAALNRFRLTPALMADPANTRPLVRSIVAEGILVIAILAVVAGWRFTPPPRALAAVIRPELGIHIHTDAAMFQVLISPGRVGTDSFVLQLMKGDATPLQAREVTLTLSLPERGVEPLERAAELGADGYWSIRNVPIPFAGRWHVRVEALITDFEKIALEDDFDVPELNGSKSIR